MFQALRMDPMSELNFGLRTVQGLGFFTGVLLIVETRKARTSKPFCKLLFHITTEISFPIQELVHPF